MPKEFGAVPRKINKSDSEAIPPPAYNQLPIAYSQRSKNLHSTLLCRH